MHRQAVHAKLVLLLVTAAPIVLCGQVLPGEAEPRFSRQTAPTPWLVLSPTAGERALAPGEIALGPNNPFDLTRLWSLTSPDSTRERKRWFSLQLPSPRVPFGRGRQTGRSTAPPRALGAGVAASGNRAGLPAVGRYALITPRRPVQLVPAGFVWATETDDPPGGDPSRLPGDDNDPPVARHRLRIAQLFDARR